MGSSSSRVGHLVFVLGEWSHRGSSNTLLPLEGPSTFCKLDLSKCYNTALLRISLDIVGMYVSGKFFVTVL